MQLLVGGHYGNASQSGLLSADRSKPTSTLSFGLDSQLYQSRKFAATRHDPEDNGVNASWVGPKSSVPGPNRMIQRVKCRTKMVHMNNETFDLRPITDRSPLEGLVHLCKHRRMGFLDFFISTQNLAARRSIRLFWPEFLSRMAPVNPLLLATAISISVVRHRDFRSFLRYYTKGVDIPGFDETLLTLEDFQEQKELSEILTLEAEYVRILVDLGSEMLIESGQLIPGRNLATVWDIYWGAWLTSNPMYRENVEIGWRSSVRYGFEFNDRIHNARQRHEYSLNETNKEINHLLLQSLPPTRKRNALMELSLKQSNATKLVDRARRLYHWAPHEISAFAGQTEICSADDSPYLLSVDFHEKIKKRRAQKHEQLD